MTKKIEQHLVRYFVFYDECLSNPPTFLCSQVITPFLNSMISTNHEYNIMKIIKYMRRKKDNIFLNLETSYKLNNNFWHYLK